VWQVDGSEFFNLFSELSPKQIGSDAGACERFEPKWSETRPLLFLDRAAHRTQCGKIEKMGKFPNFFSLDPYIFLLYKNLDSQVR
jgi:hypothetical protein